MFKAMKATMVIAMVFFVTMTLQSSNTLAESPHIQIMQRLDAIQDTLDYDVIPYLTRMGVHQFFSTSFRMNVCLSFGALIILPVEITELKSGRKMGI